MREVCPLGQHGAMTRRNISTSERTQEFQYNAIFLRSLVASPPRISEGALRANELRASNPIIAANHGVAKSWWPDSKTRCLPPTTTRQRVLSSRLSALFLESVRSVTASLK